jgi:hypothetical protein
MSDRLSVGRVLYGVLAAFALLTTLTACDDGAGGPRTAGLVSSPTASLPARIDPLDVRLVQVVPNATCPMTQPFMTHFDLVLGPPSETVFVDTIALRFDRGVPVVFTASDLDRMFGTRQVLLHTTRVFTLTPQFGCGMSSTPGTVAVVVTMLDAFGGRHDATATATIR